MSGPDVCARAWHLPSITNLSSRPRSGPWLCCLVPCSLERCDVCGVRNGVVTSYFPLTRTDVALSGAAFLLSALVLVVFGFLRLVDWAVKGVRMIVRTR